MCLDRSDQIEYRIRTNAKNPRKTMPAFRGFLTAEMERFELSRRLPDLPHFECGPFSHLGTSPKAVNIITAYAQTVKRYFARNLCGNFGRIKSCDGRENIL